MTIQELKISIIQKIANTESMASLENISQFVNEELHLDSESDFETQKGIDSILKMVKEFN